MLHVDSFQFLRITNIHTHTNCGFAFEVEMLKMESVWCSIFIKCWIFYAIEVLRTQKS